MKYKKEGVAQVTFNTPWARSFWAFSPTLLPLSGLMTHPPKSFWAFSPFQPYS